jgi:Domain of unknown function (DUF4253)
LDAGALLENRWRDWVSWVAEEDLESIERQGPFSRAFPGLAPPESTPLTPAERQQALDSLLPRIRVAHMATPAARIGLVPVARPADVLCAIGWGGLANRGESLVPLTVVLRSWEDRFGARLIDVGYDDIALFVERPPRTAQAAERVAAEQVVLADDASRASQGRRPL